MELKINLENCYGIKHLNYIFEFDNNPQNTSKKSFSIYAPNGTMKSSFARTFEDISKDKEPQEERFNKPSRAKISVDGNPIQKGRICVLHSNASFDSSEAVTNILVRPDKKLEYDALITSVEKAKNSVIDKTFRQLGVKKIESEKEIVKMGGGKDFYSTISLLKNLQMEGDYSEFSYATIFNDKVLRVINDKDFSERANEYIERYDALFEETENFLSKGIFNPTKANTSVKAFETQNFFEAGHRVHIKGEKKSIGKTELEERLAQINAKIASDDTLKKIRDALAKNVEVKTFNELFEKLSPDKIQQLLDGIKPMHLAQFGKNILATIIQELPEVEIYLSAYESTFEEISKIESEAKKLSPQWYSAVNLFNARFLDMPFKLSIQNSSSVVVGKEKAKLLFEFVDEDTKKSKIMESGEIKTLSDGETRALNLLYFIFEVEARKKTKTETLFVIDDIADSFDYKNKHAIVQYLRDLTSIPYFFQIILTHNFDFFRALESNHVVSYPHCLMANKSSDGIELVKSKGIKNYFVNVIQDKINTCASCLLSSIPFTRNIIEYTKGEENQDYIKLTKMLHWKEESDSITLQDYFSIYPLVFSQSIDFPSLDPQTKLIKFMINEAEKIQNQPCPSSLCLEDKIVVSMAIRIIAEKKIIEIRRKIDPQFQWPDSTLCYGKILKELKIDNPDLSQLAVLDSVGVIVNNNIHLNSFMYEPIIDLTINHLKKLYANVKELSTEVCLGGG